MATRKNRLAEAVLMSTHNLCFEQKYEKYQNFLSENFQFLEVKVSIYLNRRVFVMAQDILNQYILRILCMFGGTYLLHTTHLNNIMEG